MKACEDMHPILSQADNLLEISLLLLHVVALVTASSRCSPRVKAESELTYCSALTANICMFLKHCISAHHVLKLTGIRQSSPAGVGASLYTSRSPAI